MGYATLIKLGIYAAGAAVVIGLISWLYIHITDSAYDRGKAAAEAAQQQATNEAVKSTRDVIERNAELANESAKQTLAREQQLAEANKEIKRLSAAADSNGCIDDAGRERLRRLQELTRSPEPASGAAGTGFGG